MVHRDRSVAKWVLLMCVSVVLGAAWVVAGTVGAEALAARVAPPDGHGETAVSAADALISAHLQRRIEKHLGRLSGTTTARTRTLASAP